MMHDFHLDISKKEYLMIAVAIIFVIILILVFMMIFPASGSGLSGEAAGRIETENGLEYVCWDDNVVDDPDDCAVQLCEYPESYTETEEYTDYEEYNETICFDTVDVEEVCSFEQVEYFQMIGECNLAEGIVSCMVTNLGTDSAAFTVNIGFGEGFLRDGTTKTEAIESKQTRPFSYSVGHKVDSSCYCEVSAPKIEVCKEETSSNKVCEDILKYDSITKQRKITKYRVVEQPCK